MNDDNQKETIKWRWGIFYYNPSDSRSFIPKRVGIGWTPNFAQPFAYVFLAASILLIVLLTKIF